MAWYDVFSSFYDAALERAYREHRALAAEALGIAPTMTVLDAPCGTGASFDYLAPATQSHGKLIGVDASVGMLRKAEARIARNGWEHVSVLRHDIADLTPASAASAVDRLHVFLGMSAMADMQRSFDALWAQLAAGGRCVIVDVHAAQLSFQGHMVNRIARADIRRRFWEPLRGVAENFELHDLPYRREHGGQIMLATGEKPR